MRIAQVAPLTESCPPQLYGGTERIVSHLTEELVRQGHQVTLFASGNSQTSAMLSSPCEQALRLNPHCQDPLVYHMMLVNRVARSAHLFDIVHFHIDYLHFPLFAPNWGKTLTTLHGRLDLPDLVPLMREFPMMPLVSISNAQRTPLDFANWYGTVHHGLPRTSTRLAAARADISLSSAASAPKRGRNGRLRLLAAPVCHWLSPPRSTRWTASTTRLASSRCSTIR